MSRSGLHAFARKYGTAPRVGDWGDFLSGALSGVFSAAHAGIAEQQQEDQQRKDSANAAAALAASINADIAATQASAQSRWSAMAHRPGAETDAAAAATASAAQDAAAAKLTDNQIPARVAAAKQALDDAIAKLRAMKKGQPGSDFVKCAVDAAQATLNKASGLQIVRHVPDDAGVLKGKVKAGNFWADPLVGPVPGWGVVGGGVGIGAILWRALRGKWGI